MAKQMEDLHRAENMCPSENGVLLS